MSIRKDAKTGRTKSFVKMSPKTCIRLLADASKSNIEKGWLVAALVGWMLLDRRAGKHSDRRKSFYKASHSRRAGNLYLLRELHDIFPARPAKVEDYIDAMLLFEQTEGFANAMLGLDCETYFSECRVAMKELECVLLVIKFLLDIKAVDAEYRSVAAAKEFAASKTGSGIKTVERVWGGYRRAAPLIYSLRTDGAFANFDSFLTYEELHNAIRMLCGSQTGIEGLLGRAASISDILQTFKKGRKSKMSVRVSIEPKKRRSDDFSDVPRLQHCVHPLSSDEIEVVKNFRLKIDK